ncbi:DUF1269 domain-containing protein [Aureibaculum sp. A20]|uniref:DUF1269 domain-containing protein n=1 Tax=Aureibaculum flavum TaxID=2795986 RepID=A0ABS0WUL4_9FLAO|nr:DUF1269 domain-containing protein [Aureibaculum flavum]MBJ2175661.1 DUF1269 domain-containing protein [Aureibaculum flavum]
MANIIVVPFKEEKKAIEALHKIKELDAYGDITLYEHMMIRKKENNQFEVLNDQTDEEGWRTLTGAAVGGLLGAIAGPVGFVIGLYSGLAVGAIADVSRYDFEDDFVKKVSNQMTVGTIAIIAEVGEDSSVFINEALEPYTSEIMRSEAGIEFDDYVDEQIEDIEDKIEDQREKLKKATKEEKVKIKSKIAELKAKRKSKIAALETRRKQMLKAIKDKSDARLKQMENRLKEYEHSVTSSIVKARKNRLKKRIKKEEEKLYQLHDALGEDIVD